MVNAQGWLDREYPKENRGKVEEIYLNEPNLEGELDLGDFTLKRVYIFPQIDKTKLIFKNLSERIRFIKLVEVQNYLNQHYPTKEEREKVKWLDINQLDREEQLEGELNLSDFVNLKGLICHDNKLSFLNLSNCSLLEEIRCWSNCLVDLDLSACSHLTKLECNWNKLTNLILPTNPTCLKSLNLSNNNFPSQDLSFLSKFINLEILSLENSKFTSSLDYLSKMEKLKELDIRHTDFNEVNIDKLPRSLEEIKYSGCKLIEIVPQLEKIKYGWCKKCQQPNSSKKWCQSCFDKEWQGIKDLTEQEIVEKFIQRQQLRETDEDKKLQWIPYEQFNNIEQIGAGGFSKIYKATWKNKEVALKILNNTQNNIKKDFLQEIANHKLFSSNNDIPKTFMGEFDYTVRCYGISRDSTTKNYLIVIQYMKDGNLREYLKNRKLDFYSKLRNLQYVAGGLKSIHYKSLVHRDLHSGNILNDSNFSFIADFGLCQPANYQKQEGKIFGILPYVAPEVLQGQNYTQKSDIYSFGIMAYEWFANSYPYPETDNLAVAVCLGHRPNIDKVPIPQLLKDLIKQCWDADPVKRPSADELKVIWDWWDELYWKKTLLSTTNVRK